MSHKLERMLDLSTINAGPMLALFLVWEVFQILKKKTVSNIFLFFPVENQKYQRQDLNIFGKF